MRTVIQAFDVWIKSTISIEISRVFRLHTSQSQAIGTSILDCQKRITRLEKKFHASRDLCADWQQYRHMARQALKEQTKRLGVKQQDLALLLDIHPTTISHWIQGRSVLSERSCRKITWLCNLGKTEALRKIALCKAHRKEREAEG